MTLCGVLRPQPPGQVQVGWQQAPDLSPLSMESGNIQLLSDQKYSILFCIRRCKVIFWNSFASWFQIQQHTKGLPAMTLP